ncbi:hypothetical protein ACOSP7_024393 [Xanthoceras sorbifolium]|uniref:Pectate lyase n=1 Tax=Xanthoceras sorbifolium TaxID=99658 RepID=A0ABQ8H8U5_9ROSI|nr:hypothetical protein JRO89_XS13G0175200 [Xanthoceras sorbifolium]
MVGRAALLFLCAVAVIFPVLKADIVEFDEFWQKRAEEAINASRNAYNPNPDEVIHHLNKHVHLAIKGGNSTRRFLKKYKGPCQATNPIDRCWRCNPKWARNRKRLADCVLGFGRGTTGGKSGRFYVVTKSTDDDLVNPKPGTLRHAVIQKRPLWIIFARDMVIRLSEELLVTSHKTIDGRGFNIHIYEGAQISLQYVKNVIIHGLRIHSSKAGNGGMIRDSTTHYGLRTRSDGDGISIYGSSNIWIDHVSMSNCMDGLIDVVQGSTAITISNCHFTNHNEVMLFGASDGYSQDQIMQVTVAFNHFGQGLVQRMPRCRWGFVHVVNNDYTHWKMYAIGGSQHPTILSQGNRFIAPPNAACKEVTKRDYSPQSVWKSWNWRSEHDLMMNGAFFVQSGSPIKRNMKNVIPAEHGKRANWLTRHAGALGCSVNKPC